MTRFVCLPYLRQSEGREGETEGDSLSLDAQLSAIRQRAAAEGWSVLPEIRDHDLRGSDPDRPGIHAMRARVAAGGVDAVIVFDLSRFARDYVWQELCYRELTARGVQVISLNDPHVDHTLNRGIIGVVNQYRTEEIARHVKAAYAERARRGIHHGRAPFGYRKEADRLIFVEDEARIVEWVFAQYLAGWSSRAIARELTARRVPTPNSRRRDDALGRAWNSQMVLDIIDRVTYTGIVRTGEAEGIGLHEPIISAETFTLAQRIRANRRRVRRERPTSWLEHLVYCGCGMPTRLARNQRDGLQFRCRADMRMGQECGTIPRGIAVHRAEALTVAALADDLANVQPWEVTFAQALARQSQAAPDAERARQRQQQRLADIARERERVLDLYAQDKLSAERWEAWDARLAIEETELVSALAIAVPAPDPTHMQAAAALLRDAREAIEVVAAHEPEVLRRLLQRLSVRVVIVPGSTFRTRHRRYAAVRLDWPEHLAAHLKEIVGQFGDRSAG